MLTKVFDLLRIRTKLVFGKGATIVTTSSSGTETTIDLAELAAVNDIAASDLAKIDGITNGTGAAGKALVLDANGSVSMPSGGLLAASSAALAALGTGQSSYAPIVQQISLVTGADGTKGIALPAAAAGIDLIVVNTSATASLPVAPVNGGNDQINSLTASTGVYTMGPGTAARFTATSATQWYTANITSVVPGTATASLPLVPDSNKDLATLRNVTVTNLDAGASGVAGTVDVFPTTASKGKLQIAVTDQTGDTTVNLQIGAMAAARTITLADPLGTANLLTDIGIGGSVCAKVTTQFDAVTGTTGTTLTDVVGAIVTVVPGTYRYRVHVAGTSTANCGMKLSFKYTTTALSSAENTTRAFTASAVAVTHNTTATDQPALLAATTAYINAVVEGTMVVTTGGTIKLQAAQNAAHVDTTSVYVGSYMHFSRIS